MMVRTVVDIILAVYLFGWAVCLIWMYRRINDLEFYKQLSGNMQPSDWPVWIWMVIATFWPFIAWRIGYLKIRYIIGKAALKLADRMLNSLKKGRDKNDNIKC
ncbi:MAG: hypothetical protein LIP10_03615 [Clostridiales bacterium]|nr:hypothetical protein [Clostridiales bacterium]